MRLLLAVPLLALAACAQAQTMANLAAAVAGTNNPQAQAKEMAEKGVVSGDPNARDNAVVAAEANALNGKVGKIETVEVEVKQDDPASKRQLMSYMLDSDWILVGGPKQGEQSGTWKFIRPARMRIETPVDGRPPSVTNAPK